MIKLKTAEQLSRMKEAGRITGEALLVAEEHIRPGISTLELDRVIRAHIEKCHATPAFLGYNGFPGSACISVNEEVIHGIPSAKKILQEGDIVKVDVGARYQGLNGDSARTFPVGKISEEAQRLIDITRGSFFEAMKVTLPGNRLGDLGHAVEQYVTNAGYSVVRAYVGHGVGEALHEDPEVPNFGTPGRGARLYAGMTLAIEPMVNVGTADVKVLGNGWTVVTKDAKLSAHYEHTVVITPDGPILLTDIK